jgi:hypothetical protein
MYVSNAVSGSWIQVLYCGQLLFAGTKKFPLVVCTSYVASPAEGESCKIRFLLGTNQQNEDGIVRVGVVDHPDMSIALSDGYVQTA